MSSTSEYPTADLRRGDHRLITIFMFMPLACFLIRICLAVRKADRWPDPGLEEVLGCAAVQHVTPPLHRDVEDLQPGLDLLVVDFDRDYEG